MDPHIQINVGNLKVHHISGTSNLVIGHGRFKNFSSHSKTNNGVGNAYGDGSYINMSPYQSTLNDSDKNDTITKKDKYIKKYYDLEEEPSEKPLYWSNNAMKDLRF